jgi:hypothetical protein
MEIRISAKTILFFEGRFDLGLMKCMRQKSELHTQNSLILFCSGYNWVYRIK